MWWLSLVVGFSHTYFDRSATRELVSWWRPPRLDGGAAILRAHERAHERAHVMLARNASFGVLQQSHVGQTNMFVFDRAAELCVVACLWSADAPKVHCMYALQSWWPLDDICIDASQLASDEQALWSEAQDMVSNDI